MKVHGGVRNRRALSILYILFLKTGVVIYFIDCKEVIVGNVIQLKVK